MLVDAIKDFFGKRKGTKILDNILTTQHRIYIGKLESTVEIIVSLDDSNKSREMFALLEEVASLSDKILLRNDGNDVRKPSFSVSRPGESARIQFANIPLGHEFTSLIQALVQTSGYLSDVKPDMLEQIRSLSGTFHFETYITMSCHNCPDVVQALNLMSSINSGISHTTIDGHMFLSEIEQHKIKAVPTVHMNGKFFDQGRKTAEQYLAKLGAHTSGSEKTNT